MWEQKQEMSRKAGKTSEISNSALAAQFERIAELLETGRNRLLEELEGAAQPEQVLATVPALLRRHLGEGLLVRLVHSRTLASAPSRINRAG